MESSIMVVKVFLVAILACSSCEVLGWTQPLNRYQVLRVTPSSENDVYMLNYLEKLPHMKTTFWTFPSVPGREVHIMVSPETIQQLRGFFKLGQFQIEVMIDDVQRLAEQQIQGASTTAEVEAMGMQPTGFDYAKYHPYEEIVKWNNDISAAYPHLVTNVTIGNSFEGRRMPGIVISKIGNNVTAPNRPAIFYQSGMHAREWIAPATVMYMTAKLLQQYGKDKNVTLLIDNVDIHVVPMVNPDGYVYTWQTQRAWRKTRTTNPGSTCVGIDPNRNLNFHFGEKGCSHDPCSDQFCGPQAFAAQEVQYIANKLQYISASNDLKGFIDFHSYSQLWMTPYAYTKDLPTDYATLLNGCNQMVASLKSVSGTVFQCGSIANIINYLSSGSSADWTYGVLNVTYSYGVELRDTGTYGFLLPAAQIVASGEETYAGLKTFAMYVQQN